MAIRSNRRMALAAAALIGAIGPLSPSITHAQKHAVEIETRDATLRGDLLALDTSSSVEIDRDGSVPLPTAEVLHLRFERRSPRHGAALPPKGEVLLVDGGKLPYQACERDDDLLQLQLADRSNCRIRIDGVRSWWLDLRELPSDTTPRIADVLWVKPRRGRGVTPIEGVVLDLMDEGVRFALSSDEESNPVVAPWSRLAGVEFFHETPPSTAQGYLIRTWHGQSLVASGLRVFEDRLEWESRYGSGDLALSDLNSIDLSTGRVTPVARLTLLEQTWKPFYDLGPEDAANGFARNASLTGGTLQLLEPDPRAVRSWPAIARTRSYESGVALKSLGVARFALPSGASRLKGRVGLDPSCVRSGSAKVTVLADSGVIWTGAVDGTTEPVEINAPLKNAVDLTLRVDYGDNLDAGDHVHFANLRVIQ